MKKYFLISLLFLFGLQSFSQRKPMNIQKFDENRIHYGFWLGYTQSSLIPTRKANYTFTDSLFSTTPIAVGSFVVGPIASLNFNQNVHLRTGLFLSFQDRNMDYVFWIDDTTELKKKKVNSVYTEIPLQLKLRTNRIGNIAFYGIGGFKVGWDWNSNIKVEDKFNYDDVLKINRLNLAYQVGGGVDFFLQYFKFGVELRLDVGVNNVLHESKNYYNSPFEKLHTQMWQLSFTFEG